MSSYLLSKFFISIKLLYFCLQNFKFFKSAEKNTLGVCHENAYFRRYPEIYFIDDIASL